MSEIIFSKVNMGGTHHVSVAYKLQIVMILAGLLHNHARLTCIAFVFICEKREILIVDKIFLRCNHTILDTLVFAHLN